MDTFSLHSCSLILENAKQTAIMWEPINIAYEIFYPAVKGNNKLAPVIFLHDILCSKETWDEIPQRVANGTKRKVYAYDARNHGDSDYTNAASFHFNVYDLFYFMDLMKIKEEVILVGHGMGGITAITAAIEMPCRIEKIFVVEMYVRRLPVDITTGIFSFMIFWDNAVQILPKDTPEEDITSASIQKIIEKMPQDTIAAPERDALVKSKFVYKHISEGEYEVSFNTRALAEALKQYQFWPKESRGKYKGPAYFLYGAFSCYKIDSEAVNIRKHFPKAQLIQFKGASHYLMVDFPDKFVHTIMNKLSL